ncbi:MAG: hypothetical protein IJX46_07200 [Clostridia bacterium]|nr:hypothetical protein [Clostridia bacterium]
MYRSNVRRRPLPENYNGTAFSRDGEEKIFVPPPTDCECCEVAREDTPACGAAGFGAAFCGEKREPSLPAIKLPFLGMAADDLLIIGLILLLAGSDSAGEILPFLILLLFF